MNVILRDRHGNIKVMSKRSWDLIKSTNKRWEIFEPEKTEKKVFNKPKVEEVESKTEEQPKKEPTREEMIAYLKDKGINVHWNLGDEKLKQRYESENQVG